MLATRSDVGHARLSPSIFRWSARGRRPDKTYDELQPMELLKSRPRVQARMTWLASERQGLEARG
jgi:hypothetical protein